MISILIIIIAISLIINLILFVKYRKLKKSIQEYKSIGTGRYGFYNFHYSSLYSALVYVKELDRYTNGFSKIEIYKIETTCSVSYRDNTINMIKDKFISLKNTSDIEWLESEDQIKKLRKEKLEKISK